MLFEEWPEEQKSLQVGNRGFSLAVFVNAPSTI